ncbi:MAG: ATP-binding protein [Candidatus Dormibacteria bacterium]
MPLTVQTPSVPAFDQLPDAALLYDADGVVRGANRAVVKVTGLKLDDILGHRCTAVDRVARGRVPECARANCPLVLIDEAAMPPGTVPGDGLRPVSWRVSPTEDGGRLVLGLDVTQYVDAVQNKDALISTTAHELKTPLTSIRAMSELMLEFELPPQKQRELTRDILTQTGRLQQLIEDILDVSRIDSGRLTYRPGPVDLVDVVRQVIDDVAQSYPDRQVTCEIEGELPHVVGEEGKTHQIVMNLVTNAIKYSPENTEVVVRLRGNRTAGQVSLEVEDHGFGIAEEAQPHIFSKFYRADDQQSRNVMGTGLGLYIVQSLVEIQGGDIRVASKKGEGSTFIVTLNAHTGRMSER